MNSDKDIVERTDKILSIVESIEDRNMLKKITQFTKDFLQPISDVQVSKLVLNDIECPTDYAKVKQIKADLLIRYYSIIDIYYDLKKKELEIKLLDEKISKEKHSIKKNLKILEKEKMILQFFSYKSKLEMVLTEMKTYYKYYNQFNNGFDKLSSENICKMEKEMWSKKALNNPVIFEERYGSFIKEILGEDKYLTYLNKRKTMVGSFPRELIQ